jgi:H+-transporting ATPase
VAACSCRPTLGLTKYGPDAIVEKEVSLARKILGHFTRPIAHMIEDAPIVFLPSSAIETDFSSISAVLFSNAALEFWWTKKPPMR